jgi:hypothetical protein
MKAGRPSWVTYRGVGAVSNWRGPPHEKIPRCGARTRSGGHCGHYSMKNGRCRYHGGKSTGARTPRVQHGGYTKAAIEERKLISQLLQKARSTIAEIS